MSFPSFLCFPFCLTALRVIFDASDCMGKVGEDDDLLEHEDNVDLTALRSEVVTLFPRAILTLLP